MRPGTCWLAQAQLLPLLSPPPSLPAPPYPQGRWLAQALLLNVYTAMPFGMPRLYGLGELQRIGYISSNEDEAVLEQIPSTRTWWSEANWSPTGVGSLTPIPTSCPAASLQNSRHSVKAPANASQARC